MAEYIEREALLEKAKELAGGVFGTPRIIVAIKNAPKADVVEVKHGEWTKSSPYNRFMNCSVCGFGQDHTTFKYCPLCGAKMDQKEGAEG